MSELGDIIGAVQPGATGGADRVEQTSFLVRAEVLDARSDQIGGDGDAVLPPANLTVDLSRRCGPDQSCRSPVLRQNSVLTY